MLARLYGLEFIIIIILMGGRKKRLMGRDVKERRDM